MKKIDLNIKKDDFLPKEDFKNKKGSEISKDYILMAFQLYQQQERGLAMEEQRKIYKLLDELDNMKNGVLELEDDRHGFLKKVFNEVKWVGGTKIVVRIADKLEEAKEEKAVSK